MEKLEPCPFCGNKNLEITYDSELGDSYSEGPEVYSIYCICGAYMSNESKSALIESWNRRTQDEK